MRSNSNGSTRMRTRRRRSGLLWRQRRWVAVGKQSGTAPELIATVCCSASNHLDEHSHLPRDRRMTVSLNLRATARQNARCRQYRGSVIAHDWRREVLQRHPGQMLRQRSHAKAIRNAAKQTGHRPPQPSHRVGLSYDHSGRRRTARIAPGKCRGPSACCLAFIMLAEAMALTNRPAIWPSGRQRPPSIFWSVSGLDPTDSPETTVPSCRQDAAARENGGVIS